MRRAVTTKGFAPMPKPGPDDWLASHPEKGQSFVQFVESRPNIPGQPRSSIVIAALKGGERPSIVSAELLRDYASAFYATPAKVIETSALGDEKPLSRTNKHTKKLQLKTPDILAILAKRLPDDAFCVMAFTMIDLYPDDDWNYVFGQASLKERVGVFSFARYESSFFGEAAKPGDDLLAKRRALGVMAHEIGHMFGLAHCVHYACAMNGSNNLSETDRAPLHLCPICLRKVWSSVKFDPVQRYGAIAKIYADVGLETDKKWVDERIAELT